MCTVTVIGDAEHRLLTMNRDDATARREAGPRVWNTGKNTYVAPLDLRAGGTWIAANSNGIVACLLNRYDNAAEGDLSRGGVAPAAMASRTAAEAVDEVRRLDHRRYKPFTCLILSPTQDFRLDWNGMRFDTTVVATPSPWMVTSSSWRGDEVRAQRKALFDRTIALAKGDINDALAAFHCRRIPDNDAWAPMMLRHNSQTKSVTQIALNGHEIEMSYWSRESAIANGLRNSEIAVGIWSLV